MSVSPLRVKVADVVIGSKILEPVRVNNTLLCKPGTTVSEQLKRTLPKFGITEVTISPNGLPREDLTLSKLSDSVYDMIKHLNLNDLILCAKKLVDSAATEDTNLLHALLEYDKSTYQHCMNVAVFSLMVGVHINLPLEDLTNLSLGALLHDVGKLSIPLDILNKPGKLDDDEYSLIKQHPFEGYRILSDAPEINAAIRQIVWQHHENWDGSGYPRHLKGRNSYRLARIVHACDVYEALCVKRSYKQPFSRTVVRQTLEQNSGTMFDPGILSAFLECMPMYLLGETVTQGHRTGVIIDVTDRMNPLVSCHDTVYTLRQFEQLDPKKVVMSYSIA